MKKEIIKVFHSCMLVGKSDYEYGDGRTRSITTLFVTIRAWDNKMFCYTEPLQVDKADQLSQTARILTNLVNTDEIEITYKEPEVKGTLGTKLLNNITSAKFIYPVEEKQNES